MRDSNIPNLLACLTPESGGGAATPERIREIQSKAAIYLKGFPRAVGYRVVGTETAGDDQVILKVQAAAHGAAIDLRVRRIGAEWKVALSR